MNVSHTEDYCVTYFTKKALLTCPGISGCVILMQLWSDKCPRSLTLQPLTFGKLSPVQGKTQSNIFWIISADNFPCPGCGIWTVSVRNVTSANFKENVFSGILYSQFQKTCRLRNLLLHLWWHLLFQFLYQDGTKIEKVGLYRTCRPGTKTGTINSTVTIDATVTINVNNVKVNSEEALGHIQW